MIDRFKNRKRYGRSPGLSWFLAGQNSMLLVFYASGRSDYSRWWALAFLALGAWWVYEAIKNTPDPYEEVASDIQEKGGFVLSVDEIVDSLKNGEITTIRKEAGR